MVIGGLVTRVAGTTQAPVTQSGQGAVVTGIAGGAVSSLAYAAPAATPANSAAILAQTRIAFVHGHQIYTMGSDGSSPMGLTSGTRGASDPAWSPDGAKIAYQAYDPTVSHWPIYTMLAGGTGLTRVGTGTTDDGSPSWSPDGTKIAYSAQDSTGYIQVWVMTAGGASPHRISDGTTNDVSPSWSPDGTKIAFQRFDTVVGHWQIYTMTPTGGSIKRVTSLLTGNDLSQPAWSPDGSKIAISFFDGAQNNIYVLRSDGLDYQQITSDSAFDYSPCYSPDGTKIAFQRLDTGVGHDQIYVISADGTGEHRISDGQMNDDLPNWGPYIKARKFVGAGGAFGTTAAGFLVGQQGKVTTSLVVFNAQTPNSAHLDVQGTTLPYQPNLVFTVSGDLLNALAYVNSLTGAPTIVLNASSTATGAVVSFDANDGTVTGVFPYTANKAVGHGGAPTPERSGDTLVYRASFLGVWDGQGKNQAPGGASEIRLDAKTGRLLSFR
jgi:TolB protein